jgi:hypothetical protein
MCKRHGIESVAELIFMVLNMYSEAALISSYKKLYSIPCHATGHINVMLVLQSCTDSTKVLPGPSTETLPTSDGACNFSNTEVEGGVDVKENDFIAVNKEENMGRKEEEIPEHEIFPDIKSETDEVSYVCVSVIRHILPFSRNVICVYDVGISG